MYATTSSNSTDHSTVKIEPSGVQPSIAPALGVKDILSLQHADLSPDTKQPIAQPDNSELSATLATSAKESMFSKFLRGTGAFLLGSGRIASAAAIQNLNIRDSFMLWNLSRRVSNGFAIVAASCNAVTIISTRVIVIYDQLPPKCNFNSITNFSSREKAGLYTILGIGLIESVYFVAGFFNSVLKMRCNLFGEEGCEDLAWESPNGWLALAGYCALSSEISFLTFNMPIIKKHGVNSIIYMRDFKQNIKKENKYVLLSMGIITLMSSLALSGQYYYSTLDMSKSFFGQELQENIGVKLQIPLAMGSIVLVNIFTQIADIKVLLDSSVKTGVIEGIKKALKRWYIEPKSCSRLLIYLMTSPLLADTLFNGVAIYAGTAALLNGESNDLVVGLSIANCVNSLLLYFAFNIHRAMDVISNTNENSRVVENKPPLLQPLLQSDHLVKYDQPSTIVKKNRNVHEQKQLTADNSPPHPSLIGNKVTFFQQKNRESTDVHEQGQSPTISIDPTNDSPPRRSFCDRITQCAVM